MITVDNLNQDRAGLEASLAAMEAEHARLERELERVKTEIGAQRGALLYNSYLIDAFKGTAEKPDGPEAMEPEQPSVTPVEEATP